MDAVEMTFFDCSYMMKAPKHLEKRISVLKLSLLLSGQYCLATSIEALICGWLLHNAMTWKGIMILPVRRFTALVGSAQECGERFSMFSLAMNIRTLKYEAEGSDTMSKKEVPIWERSNLTLEEAAAYFGIGINRLREMTNDENCKFVLWIGNKRMNKRKALEKFLDESYSI